MVHLPDIRLHTKLCNDIAPTIGISILSLMKVGTTYPAGFIPKGLDPYRPKQLASGFRPKRQGIRSDELPTA